MEEERGTLLNRKAASGPSQMGLRLGEATGVFPLSPGMGTPSRSMTAAETDAIGTAWVAARARRPERRCRPRAAITLM